MLEFQRKHSSYCSKIRISNYLRLTKKGDILKTTKIYCSFKCMKKTPKTFKIYLFIEYSTL